MEERGRGVGERKEGEKGKAMHNIQVTSSIGASDGISRKIREDFSGGLIRPFTRPASTTQTVESFNASVTTLSSVVSALIFGN